MINIGTSTINAVKLGTTNISAVYIGTTQIYPAASAYSGFYIEDASGSANTVSIVKNDANAPTLTIETSTNGTTWTTLGTTSTTALNITVPANGKVYVRCNANSWGDSTYYNVVSSTGDFNVGGNIMSLLYGSNFTGTETSFPSGSTRSFYNMFYGASHLVDASALELPAITLVDNCYYGMFNGCSSLTTTPTLPATTLAQSCYYGMFKGCSLITTAPALNATAISAHCYHDMFNGCTSLTSAPATLPATTVYAGCYWGMFYLCTSLTTPPTLPATTFANNCYQGMFRGCSQLTSAPVINGVTPVSNCLVEMFRDCPLINSVRTKATTWNDTYASNWLSGVAATGTFYNDGNATIPTSSASGIPSGWTTVMDWFYVEDASGSANTVSIKKGYSGAPTLTIETSTDGTTWTTLGTTSTTALNISIPANGKVYVRCTADSWGNSNSYNVVSSTGNFNVGGNIMSLLYGSNFTGRETSFPASSTRSFYRMFYTATRLVDASALKLPATTLVTYCYYGMFQGCTALTAAPALPATKLLGYCYQNMFNGCTHLNSITCLATDISAYDCTTNWVSNVAANGTFTKAASMSSWTRGANGIPTGWTTVNI